MNDELMDVLGRFTQRLHYSAGQVAALSGVPRRTVMNWLSGRVRQPHDWRRLVQVAAALRLTEMEATELLQSAGHASVARLRREATAVSDQQLLAVWPAANDAPFQVISDLSYFVGREEVLAELRAALQNGRSITLYSLHGMGGVGKTALAVHLAYQLRPAFPDGVLWARLDTTDTMTILASFAAAYGQDVSMHHDVETRAGAVRAILTNKRALIVLDNAQTSAQVRPLLPASTGKTTVIVTTRHDLAVSDNMQRCAIETFSSDGAEALLVFQHFLGKPSTNRWRPELQEIAAILGQLPLAVAIAAGRLAAQVSVSDYLAQLRTAEKRLDSLIREDRSVRLSFDLSHQMLAPQVQQFFVSLGAFGGDDFSAQAAAHVADVAEKDALRFLSELIQLSLVQRGRPERYSLHPLLRDFAREKQPDAQFSQRMIHWFVEFAVNHAADYAQVGVELSNVTFALDSAWDMNMTDSFVNGVLGVFPTWRIRGDVATAVPYLENALTTAQTTGDRLSQARLLSFFGVTAWVSGKPQESEAYHKQGLTLAYALEDANLISKFLIDLGSVAGGYYGDYDQAKTYLLEAATYVQQINAPERSAALFLTLGNVVYEQGDWRAAEQYWHEGLAHDKRYDRANTVSINLRRNLGVLAMVQGRFDAANTHLYETLALSRDLNAAETISSTLSILGQVATEQADYARAQELLEEALHVAREVNAPEAVAQALINLGQCATYSGAISAATNHFQEALVITQEADLVWLAATAHLYRGELYLKTGKNAAARQDFTLALETANTLNAPEQKATALFGLARVYLPTQPEQSIRHARESAAIFAELGHFTVDSVRQWIDNVSLDATC